MVTKISVCLRENEYRGRRYYKEFEIIDELPQVGDEFKFGIGKVKEVKPCRIDCEQSSDDIWNYDYYRVVTEIPADSDDNGTGLAFEMVYYIAIENPVEYDEDFWTNT